MEQPLEVPAHENPKDGKFADNYTFNPVSVNMRETAGVIFLGLLAIFLFIELLYYIVTARWLICTELCFFLFGICIDPVFLGFVLDHPPGQKNSGNDKK